jgi:hypothetical protein
VPRAGSALADLSDAVDPLVSLDPTGPLPDPPAPAEPSVPPAAEAAAAPAWSPPSLDPEAAAPASLPALEPLAARSFLAQPLPLKCTAGAWRAFFIGPLPQTGQASGPGAKTPCMNSVRWPQLAQM